MPNACTTQCLNKQHNWSANACSFSQTPACCPTPVKNVVVCIPLLSWALLFLAKLLDARSLTTSPPVFFLFFPPDKK